MAHLRRNTDLPSSAVLINAHWLQEPKGGLYFGTPKVRGKGNLCFVIVVSVHAIFVRLYRIQMAMHWIGSINSIILENHGNKGHVLEKADKYLYSR